MQFTRAYWSQIVPDRLSSIYDKMIRNDRPDSIIRDLCSSSLASQYYDRICLAIDVWYLFDRRSSYANRRFMTLDVTQDPIIQIMFGIIIQAISDSRSNRPCDSRSWRLDHSPGDGEHCTPTVHICATEAVAYVRDIAVMWEPALNLSAGTLVSLLTKENGSVKSRSQEIINYIGQES